MEISDGIILIQESLWIEKEKALIISDLHLGYEDHLHHKGIFLPKFQIKTILSGLELILQKVRPRHIIINGDLKHEFGRISEQEWKDILTLIDLLLKHCPNIILIQGNHDSILRPIATKRNLNLVRQYSLNDTLIIHGDEIVETECKRIIIGHEHPAISLREKSKVEKYKCFLKGSWKRKELIALPSFNPLVEGTNILQAKFLSPFLTKISNFEVFIVGKREVYNFGKVKDIQKQQE